MMQERKKGKRSKRQWSKPQRRVEKNGAAERKRRHDSNTKLKIRNSSIFSALLVCVAILAIVSCQPSAAEPNMGPLGPPVPSGAVQEPTVIFPGGGFGGTFTGGDPCLYQQPLPIVSPEIPWRTWSLTAWTTYVTVEVWHVVGMTKGAGHLICIAVSTLSYTYTWSQVRPWTITQTTSLPTTTQTTYTTQQEYEVPVEVGVTQVIPVTQCSTIYETYTQCSTIYETNTQVGIEYYYSTFNGTVTSSLSTNVPTSIVTTSMESTGASSTAAEGTAYTIVNYQNVPCFVCYLQAVSSWEYALGAAMWGAFCTFLSIAYGGYDNPQNWWDLGSDLWQGAQPPPTWGGLQDGSNVPGTEPGTGTGKLPRELP